jgi:phosphate starvation-inducible protein PhoH and related proteins
MPKAKRAKGKCYESFEEFDKSNFREIPIKSFEHRFKNVVQRLAWTIYQQHDILFMLGPAGTGKSHLAIAFAVEEVLNKVRKKIILTRPVIEAGESLGFLPGTFDEKINPYMMPLWDCIEKICGPGGHSRDIINQSYEVAPLAYMRGRTFSESVCILDEAQNCTAQQIKLFLTRMGENSKMIITGDPKQSDLSGVPDLIDVVCRLESLSKVGVVYFNEDCIVRHPLVGQILKRLEN